MHAQESEPQMNDNKIGQKADRGEASGIYVDAFDEIRYSLDELKEGIEGLRVSLSPYSNNPPEKCSEEGNIYKDGFETDMDKSLHDLEKAIEYIKQDLNKVISDFRG